MKLKVQFISLLGVFFTNIILANPIGDTLIFVKKADSLYQSGYYYQAGNYYQKAYYYSVSTSNKIEFILKKIACLKQQGLFADVDNIISSVNTDNLNDTQLLELFEQGALCCYLSNDFKKAESYLIMLEYNLSEKSVLVEKHLLYSLILNEQQRWNEAGEKLKSYINYTTTDSALKVQRFKQVDSLYNPSNYPKLKKPEMARLLSHLFPGLGQVYAGAIAEGLSSFALNACALSITGLAIYYKYYISGIIAGDFLFGKLYFGGAKRAEFLARKRNYKKCNLYNAKIKSISLNYLK